MSEDGKKIIGVEAAKRPKVVLSIVHDTETGQIEVNGPIDNEIYIYGLLEKARQAVVKHNARPESNLVVPVMQLPPRQ